MITELVIAGLTTYAYRKAKYNHTHKCEHDLENRWMAAMIGAGVKNKNEESETYELTQIIPTQYGFCCCVKIPYGLSFGDLIKLKPVIETNLGAICEFEKDKLENYAVLKIIENVFKNDYEPVKTRANEIFLGYKLDGSKYILDLNTNSHILIAGMTGSGKSFLFASILTNLIYYNSKDIDIYLFQIMKGEIDIFKNCPSVKFTSDNENEILIMLKRLTNLIHKRSKQFTELGIKNISQWNKHFPNKRMKRIIIGAEEVSFFMNEENEHFLYFTQIVKAGRSVGIHFISLTQRTTSANLGGNGELKSQLTVITAKQRGEIDSKNAIDVYDAAYLEPQEFIASSNEGLIKFMAPTIDEDFKVLNKYVPEIVIPEDITIKPIKEKTVISGGWHLPTQEEWKSIRDNIPEVTYIKQEEKIPVGQMKAPRKNKKNGVISLDEVRESVNA